ncbi:50S ribosomal protein L10 [candidate division KSB3 bacterium]|uniref:Large ribosomal subunit protein uL10 n=1 Tax=candidate division KSB3 bacterium TaxID=2044937 RepID=A0A2G6E0Q6_9BACT|nr:MAG: 50S ribosomal protein L10 [candidate division KSB3 bacterium]PIE31048.1 MAG: 50S ribosomal protein L10 [candidate division KSB3 bacterium]
MSVSGFLDGCQGVDFTELVNKSEKRQFTKELQERFQASESAICVDFLGINVEKISRFRAELDDASGSYHVVKNTLARRAVEESGFEELRQFFVGPTGVVLCGDKVADVAKVVAKFAKAEGDAPVLKIKGGMVEGTVLDVDGIKKLATLPSREELLSKLVASLESPVSGLVFTLQGIVNEFVYTLQAVAEKRASDG